MSHCNVWLSTSRSMSCVHKLTTAKTLSPTKDVVFVFILRVRSQCTSPSARILEELSAKHKSTTSWIPLNITWLERPGTSAGPDLALTRFPDDGSANFCTLVTFQRKTHFTFHRRNVRRPSVPFRKITTLPVVQKQNK